MLLQHLDPLAFSLFNVLAIVSLLLSFVMLGSRWLKNCLYVFAALSWAIAALTRHRHITAAILSFILSR